MKQVTIKQRHFIEWLVASVNEDGSPKPYENLLVTILRTGKYDDEFGEAINEILSIPSIRDKYVSYLKSDQCHSVITI